MCKERYIQTEFAYNTKLGRISEISSDMNKLCAIWLYVLWLNPIFLYIICKIFTDK